MVSWSYKHEMHVCVQGKQQELVTSSTGLCSAMLWGGTEPLKQDGNSGHGTMSVPGCTTSASPTPVTDNLGAQHPCPAASTTPGPHPEPGQQEDGDQRGGDTGVARTGDAGRAWGRTDPLVAMGSLTPLNPRPYDGFPAKGQAGDGSISEATGLPQGCRQNVVKSSSVKLKCLST